MLFRKDMDPRCAYCTKGSRIGEDKVACVKRGVVCRRTTAAHLSTTH